jgi:hypothetical protein
MNLIAKDSGKSKLEKYIKELSMISFGGLPNDGEDLDFLAEQGLVEKQPIENRHTILILTDKGKRVLEFFS